MGSYPSKTDKLDNEYKEMVRVCKGAYGIGVTNGLYMYILNRQATIKPLIENNNSWKANLLRHFTFIVTAHMKGQMGARNTLFKNFEEYYSDRSNKDHVFIVDSLLSKYLMTYLDPQLQNINQGVQLRM